jgi:hypothetical protein
MYFGPIAIEEQPEELRAVLQACRESAMAICKYKYVYNEADVKLFQRVYGHVGVE